MTTRASRLLELRRQAQESHGYAPSSRWYTYLSNAINYLELAETAPAGIDQFRNAWFAIYNVFMMSHQAGAPENLTLSNWIGEMKANPLIQQSARSFPTKLLEAAKQAEQDLFWDAEQKKWRVEGRTAVENWLKKRTQNQDLSGENACSSAFLIGRDLRNAVSHPTLNPNKAKVKTALALVGDAFLRLAEVAIQTTIEHPRPGTTGRATAYRFFLYPYLKNSDGFLSDYYLERLLPDQELGAFSQDESKEQLKLVQKELQLRRATLVPATDVAVTIAQWCQAVLFPILGMQPQPGPRIVAEQAVFEPTFALAQVGMSIQPEYQGKAAGQELDALIWVLPWRDSLDSKADIAGLEGLSAMEVAQQALVQADVAWGVVTNGKLLRLLHKASAHRPRSFLEVDLETISVQWIQPQARLAFRYMLGLFSQVSFVERDSENRTRLDRVLAQSERHGKEIGDELKQNVFKALEELGDGFLYLMRQNPELARRWQQRQGSTAPIEQYLDSDELLRTIYEESLTLLYRLLFLFYAESRDLLPMHDELYRDTYSLEALRDDIISVHDDPDPRRFFSQGATDLDVRLRELFGLIDVGFGNLIPAYNGGLFDPEQHPFLESFKVGDYYLARAIDLLSRTRPQNGQVRGEGRKKVTYRDLDVRHLGEIYEGLLEYSAHIAREEQVIFERKKNNQKYEEYVAASELSATERRQLEEYRRARAENPEFPSLPRGCSVTGVKEPGQYFLVYGGKESKRKSSGSYYTPDYIVQYIVENTLGPLVRGENREGDKQNVPLNADEILNLKVLDPAMGSGHFLVAATEYLARAYGQALIREGRDSDGTMSDAEFIRYKRMVAERCIYGVDINPMAVELAKLSLWLFTMDPQRPLSFLDHHLKCGNALIGAWIKDLGSLPGAKQQPGQLNLFEARFLAQIPTLVGNVLGIMHRETLSREDIADKKALDHAIEELKQPFRNIAHAWVATYFGEQARDYDAWLVNPEEARGYHSASAAQHRFFHWELEFPEIFFDIRGDRRKDKGFSAVVGNPPYINAMDLNKMLPSFVKPFWKLRFSSASGTYDIYVLFIEQSIRLLQDHGRVALITPNKYLSAPYAVSLRNYLAEECCVRSLFDVSRLAIFDDPSVYPIVSIISRPADLSTEKVYVEGANEGIKKRHTRQYDRNLLNLLPDRIWGFLLSSGVDTLQKVMRVSVPFSDLATINASSTAAESDYYTKIIVNEEHLQPGQDTWKIVNTGTIDPYRLLWGLEDFSHGGNQFKRPVLIYDPSIVSDTRRSQYNRRKIIFSKIAKRIEAAVDINGTYASVNTNFAIFDNELTFFYLAILNSKLMSWVYEQFFGALRMGGGYLQFQAPQLRVLPMFNIKEGTSKTIQRHIEIISQLAQEATMSDDNQLQGITDRIDGLVFDLYGLTRDERDMILGNSDVPH